MQGRTAAAYRAAHENHAAEIAAETVGAASGFEHPVYHEPHSVPRCTCRECAPG